MSKSQDMMELLEASRRGVRRKLNNQKPSTLITGWKMLDSNKCEWYEQAGDLSIHIIFTLYLFSDPYFGLNLAGEITPNGVTWDIEYRTDPGQTEKEFLVLSRLAKRKGLAAFRLPVRVWPVDYPQKSGRWERV